MWKPLGEDRPCLNKTEIIFQAIDGLDDSLSLSLSSKQPYLLCLVPYYWTLRWYFELSFHLSIHFANVCHFSSTFFFKKKTNNVIFFFSNLKNNPETKIHSLQLSPNIFF